MSESKPLSPVVLPARDLSTESAASIIVPRPAVLSSTPDAVALLKALQRRWAMALGLGLLAAAASGAQPGSWFSSEVHGRRIAPDCDQAEADHVRSQRVSGDYRTYQRTQVALIKNRTVLSHALALPDVVKLETVKEQVDADEWLEEQLKVEFPAVRKSFRSP